MPEPKKHSLKGVEKTATDFDTSKLVKPHKEPKVSELDVCPGVLEPCVLATVKDMPAVPRKSRSLMQLSQTVVHSVSTLMVSALQSGWRLCKWKVSTIPPPGLSLIPPSLPLSSITIGFFVCLFVSFFF